MMRIDLLLNRGTFLCPILIDIATGYPIQVVVIVVIGRIVLLHVLITLGHVLESSLV